ncbi:MAG: hypothetical protein OXC84_10440 [Gammaproteobacteria bacterium]|nr:hypothetical protein [Gammaproteobacteria bacterium]
MAGAIDGIDVDALCREYDELGAVAPSRPDRDKCYFVGHEGRPRAKTPGHPSEKHLAIALWRLGTLRTRADVTQIPLLDYQFPLKAARSDRGLGEVDLLGATAEDRIAIIELKVKRRDGTRGESPVHALMEGLRYAAVVHANIGAISAETRHLFGVDLSDRPPIMQILAPEDWWGGWLDMGRTRRTAGPWESGFLELATHLEARLGIAVQCASLEAAGLADIAWDACGPLLPHPPTVSGVALDRAAGRRFSKMRAAHPSSSSTA